MKLFKTLTLCTVVLLAACSQSVNPSTNQHCVKSTGKVVNVFAWSGYIPQAVMEKFTCETGVTVNLSTYDSNEDMHTKLEAMKGSPSFDVVIPSSFYIPQMVQEGGLLQKYDKTRLPNWKNITPKLLHQSFDSNNDYSLPYLWGITGIAVNQKDWGNRAPKTWKDLWDPRFKNQLLMSDEPKDIFTMALIAIGDAKDINNTDVAHMKIMYKKAFDKLVQLMPNIRVFNSGAVTSMYADNDMSVGMGWIGDVYLATTENKNVTFVYPADGYVVWVDCISLVAGAQHLDQAYQFINFLYRPDVAGEVSATRGYASPVPGSINDFLKTLSPQQRKAFPPDIGTNPMVNIPLTRLDGKNHYFQNYQGSAVNKIYQDYWDLLKLGANG